MADPLNVPAPGAYTKDEIDLICSILSGRLRDLWNGKVFCAELAVDDLLLDLEGIDALSSLRTALSELKSALTEFRTASSYNSILSKVNQMVSESASMYGMGGLCPDPQTVTPPDISDVLPVMNQNLFGQAGEVITQLVQSTTPQMCFAGGQDGFGVNWDSLEGDLKNLKEAIAAYKASPGSNTDTLALYELNIKMHTRRLRAELDRLGKNIVDPAGISNSQSVARQIERLNSVATGYSVKDRRGVEFNDILEPMVTGDIYSVLKRTDTLSATPVIFNVQEIKDYCGDVTGYQKVALTGDPDYIGYTTDPRYAYLNVDNPTTNPVATYSDYDYLFIEEAGSVKIYTGSGVQVTNINLTRGQSYKIGFKLSTHTVKFYDTDQQVWTKGITYGSDPVYGVGADGPGQIMFDEYSLVQPDYKIGEAMWAVLLENPTTPNNLKWKASNGQQGDIIVDGATAIPEADKSYDLSTAFRKGLMHYRKVVESDIVFDRIRTTGRYNVRLSLNLADGSVYNINYDQNTPPHIFGSVVHDAENAPAGGGGNQYIVYKNKDQSDSARSGNKIVKYITSLPDGKFFVEKLYFNDFGGTRLQQVNYYITQNLSDESQGFKYVFNVNLASELLCLNDVKLPYIEPYYYHYSAPMADEMSGVKNYNLYNGDEFTFNLVGNDTLELWLTEKHDFNLSSLSENEFLWYSSVKIAPEDLDRNFFDTDPYLWNRRVMVKGLNGTSMTYEVVFKDHNNGDTSFRKSGSIAKIVEEQDFEKFVEYYPITVSNGLRPYEYSVKPIEESNFVSNGGLEFDEVEGKIYGTPGVIMTEKKYQIEARDQLDDEVKRSVFTIEIKKSTKEVIDRDKLNQATQNLVTTQQMNQAINAAVSAAISQHLADEHSGP